MDLDIPENNFDRTISNRIDSLWFRIIDQVLDPFSKKNFGHHRNPGQKTGLVGPNENKYLQQSIYQ